MIIELFTPRQNVVWIRDPPRDLPLINSSPFFLFNLSFLFSPLFSARGQQQQKKEKKKKKGCDCRLVGSYSHFLWQAGYIYVYPFFYRDEDCLLLPVDWYQGTGILFLFAPRTVFNHSTGINTPPHPPVFHPHVVEVERRDPTVSPSRWV